MTGTAQLVALLLTALAAVLWMAALSIALGARWERRDRGRP